MTQTPSNECSTAWVWVWRFETALPNITSAGQLIGSLFYIEEPPTSPPDSPWALPQSPHTSAGDIQELPQMLLKSPRVSQSPPRGSEYLPSSLEPILGGSSALKCDACAQKLAVWNTAAGAAGAADSTEVVARSAARSPSPHAPGARMTVVTLTPSFFLYR